MVDIISLVIAISGLLIGVLSHIRHSECFGVKIDTRTPPNTPCYTTNSPAVLDSTSDTNHNITDSYQATQPIDITTKRQVVKNWL